MHGAEPWLLRCVWSSSGGKVTLCSGRSCALTFTDKGFMLCLAGSPRPACRGLCGVFSRSSQRDSCFREPFSYREEGSASCSRGVTLWGCSQKPAWGHTEGSGERWFEQDGAVAAGVGREGHLSWTPAGAVQGTSVVSQQWHPGAGGV